MLVCGSLHVVGDAGCGSLQVVSDAGVWLSPGS